MDPDITIDDIRRSFNPTAEDSFNETNLADIDVEVDDSFNEDNSTDNSVDLDVEVDDSFNDNSDNSDNSINDSLNDNSDNSDNSTNDSFNDNSQNAYDSFNTDNSSTDNSVNAGEREYNTGFGGYQGAAAASGGGGGHHGHHGGGGGGGGGDVYINDADTVVDQSSNNNIAALGGDVGVVSTNAANVASGDDSVAVAGDYTSTVNYNGSTNIGNGAGGDVQIGDNTYNTTITDSFNTDVELNYFEDNSIDVDVADSFNSYESYSLDNVGNTYDYEENNFAFDADVNAIVDSEGSAILEDIELEF